MTNSRRAARPHRRCHVDTPTTTTYASLPWSGILPLPPEPSFQSERRAVDYGFGPLRRHWNRLSGGARFVWTGRQAQRLVICHAGTEVLVAGLLRPLLARRVELVAIDFLRPPQLDDRVLRLLLRYIDRSVVIRSGDIAALGCLGVPADRCVFAPYPAPQLSPHPESDAYVYSAGFAQRDWTTLFEALRVAAVPAVVAGPVPPPKALDNVSYLGMVSPEDGRRWLANCRFSVHASLDTLLPSGPLVILDSLALGKPVVTTDGNGSRDYVVQDANGLVVPPGDPTALAGAIASLFSDPARTEKLSRGALDTVRNLTPKAFWDKALAA